MKRTIALYFLLSAALNPFSYAQKQANIWFFAENLGLNFSTGTPVLLTNGQIHSDSTGNSEGCSSICDSSGNLLFYSSPTTIWNHNNQVMPNGANLLGGISSTQGSLIIPKPGSNELFYVFTLDEFQNNLANGLRYSMVDMCLDSGMGDVVPQSKNILLLEGTGEKMAATYHKNGNDIWLVTRKQFTNEFYSYLITSAGIIAPPVVSAIGWANPQGGVENAIGQMKISPDGSKIAFALENQTPIVAQLFDFNNSTGIVSNLIDLPIAQLGAFAYGVAFSSDNSKLYIRGVAPTGMVQFDLSSKDAVTIKNSMTSIQGTNSSGYGGTGMQLANNGKIYVVGGNSIDVINFPNLLGDACNYVGHIFDVNASYTFPGFIDGFNYNNGIPHCGIEVDSLPVKVDSTCQLSIETSIHPNPFTSILIVDKKATLCSVRMNLYNALGQLLIKDRIIIDGHNEINLINLPAGVYFYKFYSDDNTFLSGKIEKI